MDAGQRYGWWDRPVRVLGKKSPIQVVSHVEQAGEYLMYEMPTSGDNHRKARAAVLKAKESAMAAKERAAAREAFVAAVKDAGVYLGE